MTNKAVNHEHNAIAELAAGMSEYSESDIDAFINGEDDLVTGMAAITCDGKVLADAWSLSPDAIEALKAQRVIN